MRPGCASAAAPTRSSATRSPSGPSACLANRDRDHGRTAHRRSRSTKGDIVVEAAGLFAERGFAAVSVQEIGERVGITAGAIYRHFPSKEAVLHAVLLESIDAWVDAAAPAPSTDGAEQPVSRVVQSSVQLVVDRPGELATYVRERHRADGLHEDRAGPP